MEEDIEILKECVEYETFGRSCKNRRNKLDNKCFTALENILNELERLQKENELAKETIKNHCADMDKVNNILAKLKKENEIVYNIIDELLQQAGCVGTDNAVVCKSFQCALFGAEAYVKMKNKEIKQFKKGINTLMENRKKWKNRYYKLKTENSKLKIQNQNISRELLARTDKLNKLIEENEECKLDVQDYLKQAQENAEIYRKAQEKIQDYIQKQIIRNKIEELKQKKNKYDNTMKFYTIRDTVDFQVDILKEILGEEK